MYYLLSMRYLRIASMAKSEASHMISNSLDQFGADMIGAEISSLNLLSRIHTFSIKSEGHVLS